MSNWVNWLLIIGGALCVIAELVLGVLTGFDLALLGGSMATGGAVGLAFGSTKVGLFSSGALALLYLVFFRQWVRRKLTVKDQPSNVDAIVGRSGKVIARIGPHEAGRVKLGDEVWRAEPAAPDSAAYEPGATVTVESVEGVTLKVR